MPFITTYHTHPLTRAVQVYQVYNTQLANLSLDGILDLTAVRRTTAVVFSLFENTLLINAV